MTASISSAATVELREFAASGRFSVRDATLSLTSKSIVE
jgi:hypothetical protein